MGQTLEFGCTPHSGSYGRMRSVAGSIAVVTMRKGTVIHVGLHENYGGTTKMLDAGRKVSVEYMACVDIRP